MQLRNKTLPPFTSKRRSNKLSTRPSVTHFDYIDSAGNFISPIIRKNTKNITSLRNKHLENFECVNDLFECIGIKPSTPKLNYQGGGSYGQVFGGFFENGKEYAIKFEVDRIDKNSEFDISDSLKELDNGYYMGEYLIGPKVYKSFYYILSKKELNKLKDLKHYVKFYEQVKIRRDSSYKLFDNSINDYIIIKCFVMQKYSSNATKVLEDINISNDTKLNILTLICDLIHKQIFEYSLYCFDIKTDNFVVNFHNNIPDVKMIDFGSNFCLKRNLFPDLTQEAIKQREPIEVIESCKFIAKLTQNTNPKDDHVNNEQKKLLYISNVLQLIVTFDTFDVNKFGKIFRLHRPTLNFLKMGRNKMKDFLRKYLYYGMIRSRYSFTPANILIHYYRGPDQISLLDAENILDQIMDMIPKHKENNFIEDALDKMTDLLIGEHPPEYILPIEDSPDLF